MVNIANILALSGAALAGVLISDYFLCDGELVNKIKQSKFGKFFRRRNDDKNGKGGSSQSDEE